MSTPSSDRWDGLSSQRVANEPWWALIAPDSDPTWPERLSELSARSGYDLHAESYVAGDAAVVASRLNLGARSYIASGCRIRDELSVGSDCSLNPGVVTIGRVTIGNDVRIASYAVLVGENHGFDDVTTTIHQQPMTSIGVVIEDDVWIGANVTVVDGVTIGAHSVVGAGAVVTRSVPPYSVVGGVPAKVLRSRLGDSSSATSTMSRPRTDALSAFDRQVAQQWSDVIDASRTDIAGTIAWAEEPGGDPLDPRALNDAVELAAMFGELPPGAERSDLIERIQALQDPTTGLFVDPRVGPSPEPLRFCLEEWEMYGIESCGHALEVLGAAPLDPIHVVEQCGHDELAARLDGLDLGLFAWPAGSWLDGYGTALYFNRTYHGSDDTAPVLWGWLQTRQDPSSGMWGTYLPHDGHREWGWLMAVNGLYRMSRGTYSLFGVEVPRPEAIIDTVLAHARTWEWFGVEERNACNLLDIVHPLWLLGTQTEYRRAEIRDAIASTLPSMLNDWTDGRGYAWDVHHGEPGLRGTEMMLSTIYTAAAILGENDGLSFVPRGIHRLAPSGSVAVGPGAQTG